MSGNDNNPYLRPDDPGTMQKQRVQREQSWWLVGGLVAGFLLAVAVGWLLS